MFDQKILYVTLFDNNNICTAVSSSPSSDRVSAPWERDTMDVGCTIVVLDGYNIIIINIYVHDKTVHAKSPMITVPAIQPRTQLCA